MAVNQEFSLFLTRSLSMHIPDWPCQWKEVFLKHKNFQHFIIETFTTANESRLSKAASLVGCHKDIQALEMAPLGDFLIKQQDLSPREAAFFCRQTLHYTFLSSFIRFFLGKHVFFQALFAQPCRILSLHSKS